MPVRQRLIKVSVVVPAHNEGDNIPVLLTQFDQLFSTLPYRTEMIIVDDGSEDETWREIEKGMDSYPWLRTCQHRSNEGITSALATAIARSRGEIICFYPADLQYHAEELPKLVAAIDSGSDLVTGWRQGDYGLRTFGSVIYNSLSRIMFGVDVHDLNSIKAFRSEVSVCISDKPRSHMFMVAIAAHYGFKITEVKVVLHPRIHGRSRFYPGRLPGGLFTMCVVKLRMTLGLLKRPEMSKNDVLLNE